VRGFEEDQRRIEAFHGAQFPERLRKIGQKILFPDVHDNGHARNAFAPVVK